jgi:CubicO group peptidase (beta-lactamase class C family)
MKHLLCLFLLLMASMIYAQEKEKPDFSEALRVIDTWLEGQWEFDNLPGISLALVMDQDVVWKKAYGYADLEKQVSASPGTIYSICSISKLFTSIAIMQLRDAGKLRLDDLVKEHLSWFSINQKFEFSGPITIRSLLTHSSGLPREAAFPYWTGPDFPFPAQDQVKEGLAKQETLYPASTYFQYSNLGLTLLGEIIAEVSEMPYETYIQQNILGPLRLENTRTEIPEELWGKKLAAGYSSLYRNGTRSKVDLFQARGIAPAAGFSSTVEDLARFASWQFRVLENVDQKILQPSTLREMQRVHWMDPDWETSWGLGFSVYEVEGRTVVGHGGSCPGYRSILMIDPQKKSAVTVMINASGTNPSKYARAITSVIGKSISTKSIETEGKVDLEDFAGIYDSQPWWGEMVVVPWKGHLASFSLPSDNPVQGMTRYKHIEGDTFRRIRDNDELGEAIVFERDDEGRVYRVWRNYNYSLRIK